MATKRVEHRLQGFVVAQLCERAGKGHGANQSRSTCHAFCRLGGRSALLASECAHIAAQQERANPRRKDCADQTPAKRVNMMQYTLI